MYLILLVFLVPQRGFDPRITNSQIFEMSNINQYLANAKRGLSLWKAANICLWWYKSGYR
jgi:hypothetical protein